MKTLFCNGFEVSHTREVFLILFRFTAPDGHEETLYIAISPSGVSTLHEILQREIECYVKKFGDIVVENWEKTEPNRNCSKNPTYLS